MSKVTFPSQLMDFNPLWSVTWWCRRAVVGHYTFFQNFRHEGEVAKVSWRSLGGATPCCWYWFSTYLCIVQSIMQSRKIPGTFCPWLWKQILRHFRDFQVTNWDSSHVCFYFPPQLLPNCSAEWTNSHMYWTKNSPSHPIQKTPHLLEDLYIEVLIFSAIPSSYSPWKIPQTFSSSESPR